MSIKTIHPANGDILRTYEEMKMDHINGLLESMHKSWHSWKNTSFEARAEPMRQIAQLLRSEKEKYASLMTEEMGKPITDSKGEVEKCAWVCEYYADHAGTFLNNEPIDTEATKSFVTFQPLGIVLAIMPWNFPFWQVFRFAAPAIMAGNACLLKHANNVTGCSLAIEELFQKAGFPENLFQSVIVENETVEKIIEHPHIKAVTLTGSTRAGKVVAATAGKNLKKSVLELGGSDPYIVLEDADLDHAAETCVNSRLINSGQSCIAAKRFIVIESVSEKFQSLVLDKLKKKKLGDPWDKDTDVGPMARIDLMANLHNQVQDSVDKGAKCLLGGEISEGKGAFYPITLLTNVKPGMPAYEEELFGPVAVIIDVKTKEEAIRIANDTAYGLGAAIFTNSDEQGEKIATDELDAGCCFVNDLVKSDPRLPFGGIKSSGFGRELGPYGIKEFVNIKTVSVK